MKAEVYLSLTLEIVEDYLICDVPIVEFTMPSWISSDGDKNIIFLMSHFHIVYKWGP